MRVRGPGVALLIALNRRRSAVADVHGDGRNCSGNARAADPGAPHRVLPAVGRHGERRRRQGRPRDWLFPNVDLTVHLFRQPVGTWVGLDTAVTFGAGGLGVTSSWLHDDRGPVDRAEQSLTIRPRSTAG